MARLVDSSTNRAMRNWTANSNGQVIPVLPPGIVGQTVYKFPTKNITARSHNWMQLPVVSDKLTMNVKLDLIGYGIYLNGAEESIWLPRYQPVKVYPKARPVAACEAYYTGLFEILTASPGGVEESLGALGVTSLNSSTPYRIFCEAASYRFGKPFELYWDTQCGVDCYSHLLATEPCQIDVTVNVTDNKADGYEVYELFHSGQRTQHLVCRELKPAQVSSFSRKVRHMNLTLRSC